VAVSRLASRAARFASYAAAAQAQQAIRSAASTASLAYDAARENARLASYVAPTNVLTATDAGDGTATIHVAEHDRVYPLFGNVAVPNVVIEAVDITGIDLAQPALYVYYDDPGLDDTTPAMQVTDDAVLASQGSAAGRHFVGKIATPAAGGADTTGTGGTPSSWPPGDQFHSRFDT